MGLLRRHLAGGEGLDDVVALSDAALLAPAPLGVHHVGVHPLQVTVDGCLKAGALGLVPVEGVVDSGFQGGFFPVLDVAHALVQAVVYHQYLGVGHIRGCP